MLHDEPFYVFAGDVLRLVAQPDGLGKHRHVHHAVQPGRALDSGNHVDSKLL
ncbi:hypothetical protein [Mesorhizobium sp. J428]|uniref:hypothetical protein n=1 Tax=Mesorhizobium sp. J428 TaxID=2898440 RepID=UPI002151E5CB|nr:hypothetical protein [Mesorhizobium sp. J428]MCR5857000.1 hypothetical protein [Mesorhizobium sp. J428]